MRLIAELPRAASNIATGAIDLTLTIAPENRKEVNELLKICGKLTVEITKHRKTRSLNANAYFHLLVNKISAALNAGDDETKRELVINYGTLARDKNGGTVGFKLPSSVDVSTIYKYTKEFGRKVENGVEFIYYLVYKQTHLLDTKEMARLIDGTISEAKELGIQTETPEQIALMLARWKDEKQTNQGT